MYDNREQAITTAYHRSAVDGKPRFVVYEGGEFAVCFEHELDTYWAGADCVYCTLDDGADE